MVASLLYGLCMMVYDCLSFLIFDLCTILCCSIMIRVWFVYGLRIFCLFVCVLYCCLWFCMAVCIVCAVCVCVVLLFVKIVYGFWMVLVPFCFRMVFVLFV